MNTRNRNCAVVIKEPNGLYAVKEYGWTREAPYDQPCWGRPFIRVRGSYVTLGRAQDEASWVNHSELRKGKT